MPVALWCSWSIASLLAAAILDFAVGDPWHWIHPVQVMGWVIQRYQSPALAHFKSPIWQRLGGIILGVALPAGSGLAAWALIAVAAWVFPLLGAAVAAVMLASCFAGRSLRDAAMAVLAPLAQGDLAQARTQLSYYVGRDTEALTAPEIYRAVMETISENATDGVLAPLFYALVGLAIAPAGGAVLAIAYKALSTLDSMVGYRRAPYTYLGWFSARCEDVATWLPCRLTVLTVALLSRRPGQVLGICRRDAPADPSPNAGWSEAAYAAALGVQLGGLNYYKGKPQQKPLLGVSCRPIDAAVVRQGLQLTRRAFLLWLGIGLVGLSLRYGLACFH